MSLHCIFLQTGLAAPLVSKYPDLLPLSMLQFLFWLSLGQSISRLSGRILANPFLVHLLGGGWRGLSSYQRSAWLLSFTVSLPTSPTTVLSSSRLNGTSGSLLSLPAWRLSRLLLLGLVLAFVRSATGHMTTSWRCLRVSCTHPGQTAA